MEVEHQNSHASTVNSCYTLTLTNV